MFAVRHTNALVNQLLIGLPALILCCASLLSLRSVANEFFNSQLTFILIAILLSLLLRQVNYQFYTFSPWPWYLISQILLLATILFGDNIRGSTRWITLFASSFQTSEFVKPLLILFIASYLPFISPLTLKRIILFLFSMAIPALLIFLQPDLGTALVVFLLGLSGLIASGVKIKDFTVIVLIFLTLLPIFFFSLKTYQRDRLESFFSPTSDPQGSGYNALQAQIAVGSGKLFGRGLGQGSQSHLRFLPERHTDFIFASIIEELGFLGGLLILSCYLLIAAGLVSASRLASTIVGSLICLLSFSVLIIQSVINIGMNMGLVPVTGITLPLLSSGGSSLLSFGLIIGLSLSVAAHPQKTVSHLEIR